MRNEPVTPPPQEQPAGKQQDEEEEVNLNDVIQQAVAMAVNNAMKPVLEEINVQKERIAMTEAENEALRSKISRNKTQGIDFSINDNPSQTDTPVSIIGVLKKLLTRSPLR